MKSVSLSGLQLSLRVILRKCQREPLVVTRRGRPVAILIGVEGMVWEQVLLQTDDSFWRLIRRRRREPASPLAKVKKRLGIR